MLSLAVGGTLAALDADAAPPSPIRPYVSACETTFEFTSGTTTFIEGTCHIAHLGVARVEADQSVTFLSATTVALVNESVYTAANGDQLRGTFVGTGTFTSATTVEFSGIETYTGGTGRFAGAAGSAVVVGGAAFTSLSGGVGEFRGRGTLSY